MPNDGSPQNTDNIVQSPNKNKKKRVRNEAQWKKNKIKQLKNLGKQYTSRTGKTVPAKAMKPPCSDNNGQNVRVCKTFLLNTLGITDRTLLTVIEAKTSEGFLGSAPMDSRGKHDHHIKTDPEVLDSVRVHINSIARIDSHYLRANTSREYIDGGLTLADLHRDYKNMRESDNKTAANYDLYYRTFTKEFNISFFIPKKDQCDLRESRKNAVDGDEVLENQYLEHLRQKELSRAEKKNDIETCKMAESNSIVAIFDLQAVMPVPIGESTAFFYKSKLNCLNLTITDIKNKETICYFWHEALGGRGAVEIGSCVYKFLQKVSDKYPNSDVTFYTDNCCGQQKNRFIFSMYLKIEHINLKLDTRKTGQKPLQKSPDEIRETQKI
ncbi:unnamed protein product [Parnassius apollo]|uniref:(apollo) hypothetical protein n=1 Tax=Parnassius apollo TaxID=110799 RepID=A0A8S3WW11_PARAO|nr:unnamed protein product [Parnassius apollo]